MDGHQEAFDLVRIPGNRGQVAIEIKAAPKAVNELQVVSDEDYLRLLLERETAVSSHVMIG